MNLNRKQCSNTIAAVTKITRRITMHKTQEVILGKPFSNKGKTHQSLAIESREDHPYTINPSAHKRVLYDQERLRGREVCTKLQLSKMRYERVRYDPQWGCISLINK
jgi:RNase H-fold protein (predicted Holliday junction resolvase)